MVVTGMSPSQFFHHHHPMTGRVIAERCWFLSGVCCRVCAWRLRRPPFFERVRLTGSGSYHQKPKNVGTNSGVVSRIQRSEKLGSQ